MLHEVVSVEVVRHFCHIATRRLGIGIDAKVEALVAGRVAKRLKVLQLPLDEYLSRLEGDQNCDEVVGFLEVMRPRPARFFARAGEHALLRAHLELCLAAGRRRFRLWSAGCGSGEEPYAMGLTILQRRVPTGLDGFGQLVDGEQILGVSSWAGPCSSAGRTSPVSGQRAGP
jgi:chemotaxis methyl-accepting protein methylase